MSTNDELATIFDEMASLMKIQGANSFRVNAYARAAEVLRESATDVATIADDERKLTAIDGIGPAIAKKIMDYVDGGAVPQHQTLLEEVPGGLLDVMAIPGVGPKTVQALWQQGGITGLDALRTALATGELESLPRLGARSLANIKAALTYSEKAAERTLLGRALPLAETIVATLREVPGAREVGYAGSLRRGRETIGDIDILATADDPETLAEAFRGMEGVTRVLAAGATKSSVRVEAKGRGIQVDLRVVPTAALGAARLYFTGSKEHNVALRERAARRGLRLNEYGLFPDAGEADPPQSRGIAPLASETEEAIYAALDLPWIPPELRETGAWLDREIPTLLERGDIRCELHSHTTASDGRFSIEQLAAEAKRRGFHTVAITDHSKSSVQAGGLQPDELLAHIDAIHAVDAQVKDLRVLAGSEVDILTDGTLDYDDELLRKLDIVVASPHAALTQDPEKATRRLLAAVRHPLVHILGHPTGRIIGRRRGLEPDMDAIVREAAKHDTALEINASPHRLDLRDVHVAAAMQAGALIAIDTDAHGPADLEQLRYGVMTARRGAVTADRCVNTWDGERLLKWLNGKR